MLAGAGLYEARQAHNARAETQALQQEHADKIQQLQRERDAASNRAAGLTEELADAGKNQAELLKLRGEVGALRQQVQDRKPAPARATPASQANDVPADAAEQQKRMQLGKLTRKPHFCP